MGVQMRGIRGWCATTATLDLSVCVRWGTAASGTCLTSWSGAEWVRTHPATSTRICPLAHDGRFVLMQAGAY